MCECRRLGALPIAGDSMVMKIDVEGQELEVLLGAKKYFDEDRLRALYLDHYKDPRVKKFLDGYDFHYFNGRTLQRAIEGTKHLLALKSREVDRS